MAEPEGGPSTEFLRDPGRRARRWLAGSVPDPSRRRGPAGQPLPPGRPAAASWSTTTRSTRSPTPASTSTTPPARERVTFDGRGRPGDALRLLRPALRRRVLGHGARPPTATSWWPTGPSSRRAHWQALLVARAIENQAYVVGVNRVGEGGGLHYAGDSRIIDPLGRDARRRRRRRDDPPGRRRPGRRGRDQEALPVPGRPALRPRATLASCPGWRRWGSRRCGR